MIIEKKQKAFTLIEMIVSLSVIMIISVIFIANYRNANSRTDLIMTAQSLVANLHSAQNNSLGLVKYGNNVPAGGWGVNFDKVEKKYTIFADLNEPDTIGYMQYDADTEGLRNLGAREVILSSGIEISDIIITSGASSERVDIANVTFLPPDPRTNIYSSDSIVATGTELVVELREVGTESKKTIMINFLGLIEVID